VELQAAAVLFLAARIPAKQTNIKGEKTSRQDHEQPFAVAVDFRRVYGMP
jgi:hypothetical protein